MDGIRFQLLCFVLSLNNHMPALEHPRRFPIMLEAHCRALQYACKLCNRTIGAKQQSKTDIDGAAKTAKSRTYLVPKTIAVQYNVAVLASSCCVLFSGERCVAGHRIAVPSVACATPSATKRLYSPLTLHRKHAAGKEARRWQQHRRVRYLLQPIQHNSPHMYWFQHA